jgi:two-component system chemotaxis response regulator CheB
VLRVLKSKDEAVHFRCQVGHAWSSQALLATQLEKIEESLWAALRALEEHSKLTRNALELAERRKLSAVTSSLKEKLAEIDQHQKQIRALLLNPVPESPAS